MHLFKSKPQNPIKACTTCIYRAQVSTREPCKTCLVGDQNNRIYWKPAINDAGR